MKKQLVPVIALILILTLSAVACSDSTSPTTSEPETTASSTASTTPTEPPAAPTNLQAEPATTSVVITWDDVATNEQGYHVYRDGKFVTMQPKNTTTYKDLPLKPGQTYTYEVLAFNKAGKSEAAEVIVTTLSD